MATSPWYREGTAKFTQGSTTVTGTGTRWVDFVRAGDGIQGPDGKLYQVTNVASNTSMSITPAYGSETTYWTIPIQGYVKRLADAASQLVRDFEGGADEALDAADRAKQSATEASASEAAALSQANRAESEADRAETEADRAQQAADDAVAVVSGGEASVDPEPGKIPIAGAEGTIKQAWVHELEFALDKLRVATNKALYGDGPYPVLDFQFQGANMLDPRIEFTRASKDWDSQGREYGINEPVLTDEGLWVSRARTNLVRWGSDITKWSPILVDFIGGFAVPTEVESTHVVSQTINIIAGKMYTFSAIFETDGSLPVCRISLPSESGTAGVFLDTRDLSVRMAAIGELESSADILKIGDVYLVKLIFRSAMTGEVALNLTATPTNQSSVFAGDGISKFRYSKIQLEEGNVGTPYIPTEGSQVTVAQTVSRINEIVEIIKSGKDFTIIFESKKPIPTGNAFSFLWAASDGTANNLLGFRYTHSDSQMLFFYPPNTPRGVGQVINDVAVKVALSREGNVFNISVNGTASTFNVVGLDTSNLNVMTLGNITPNSVTNNLMGKIKSFSFYDQALTPAQLQELTS